MTRAADATDGRRVDPLLAVPGWCWCWSRSRRPSSTALLVNIFQRKQEAKNPYLRSWT